MWLHQFCSEKKFSAARRSVHSLWQEKREGKEKDQKGEREKNNKGKKPISLFITGPGVPSTLCNHCFSAVFITLVWWLLSATLCLCQEHRCDPSSVGRSQSPELLSRLHTHNERHIVCFPLPFFFSSFHVSYSLTFILLNYVTTSNAAFFWLTMTPRLGWDETCLIPVTRRVFTHLKPSGIWTFCWEIVGNLFGAQVVPASNNIPDGVRFLSLVIA